MALLHLHRRIDIEKLSCKSTYYHPPKTDSSLCYMSSSRLHWLRTFSGFFLSLWTEGHLAVLKRRRRRLIPPFVFLNSVRPCVILVCFMLAFLTSNSWAEPVWDAVVAFLQKHTELRSRFLKIPFSLLILWWSACLQSSHINTSVFATQWLHSLPATSKKCVPALA